MNVVLDNGAFMPERAYPTDAGLDLRTPVRVVIHPNEIKSIDTGVHIEIPQKHFGKIESKSGLMIKHKITCPGGTIDCGYTGSICVALRNESGKPYIFNRGDKVAQLVIQPFNDDPLGVVDSLGDTPRGNNGFGSTGV